MVDMDEYLYIVNDTLKNYLTKQEFNNCDFIKIHWVVSNDNNLLYYDSRPLFERFPKPYLKSRFIKSIIRGNITNLKYWVHSPFISPDRNVTCDNEGKKIQYKYMNFESIDEIKNEEAFQDILSNNLLKNFVTIIDYRGYRGKMNAPQYEAYYDCYQKNSKNYDWLSFYDLDEYLEIKNNKTIKEFLFSKKFEKCDNIKINWVIYSDNGLIYYDNRTIEERFTEPLFNHPGNIHIKSTVRGKMKINYWNISNNPHSSEVQVKTCIPSGQIVKNYKSPFQKPPNYDFAFLKHYHTKTIEEYIKKTKRGSATGLITFDNKWWNKKLKKFFMINIISEEKLMYIKQTLNISSLQF